MLRYINLLFLYFFSLSIFAQTNVKPIIGYYTDYRDKKVYKTLTIGNQTWFGYNLNFNCPDSWCYNDSSEYCKIYGRLYTLEAALSACPVGWYLPTSDDWQTLITQLGGKSVAGDYLKEAGTEHSEYPNETANNISGFKVLPSGYRDAISNNFFKLGEESVFWSSSKLIENENYNWSFFCNIAVVQLFSRILRCRIVKMVIV